MGNLFYMTVGVTDIKFFMAFNVILYSFPSLKKTLFYRDEHSELLCGFSCLNLFSRGNFQFFLAVHGD